VEREEGGKEGMKGRARVGRGSWCPQGPHMICLRHAPVSIAAAEKRPLSYKTPQFVHMVWNCGAQTCYWQCITGVKKIGENRGRNGRILTPNERVLTFWVSGLWCNVSSKLSENCDRKRGDSQTDRKTDRHTHRREWIYNLSHAIL